MQYAVVKDGIRKEFTKIYHSEQDAHDEATRLCKLEGKDFLVIQIIGRLYMEEHPIKYEDLTK